MPTNRTIYSYLRETRYHPITGKAYETGRVLSIGRKIVKRKDGSEEVHFALALNNCNNLYFDKDGNLRKYRLAVGDHFTKARARKIIDGRLDLPERSYVIDYDGKSHPMDLVCAEILSWTTDEHTKRVKKLVTEHVALHKAKQEAKRFSSSKDQVRLSA